MSIAMKDVKIKPNLLKAISKIAKNENISEKKALNEIIEKGIKKTENEIFKEKIKNVSNPSDKITIQKPRKSGKSLSTEEMIGRFKAKEPFDSVKEVKKMESGENI